MKFIFPLMILIALSTKVVHAAVLVRHPAPTIREGYNKNYQSKLYPAKYFRLWVLENYRAVIGKKLTLKHKIALKLWQWKGARLIQQGKEATPRQKKLGKMSLIFGAAAFALIPIPILNLLSFPAAIVAIVLGISSLKGNNNTNGVIGLVLGGVYLLLAFLLVVIILLILGRFFN